MQRATFFVIAAFGVSMCAFGQSTSPDSQTLQALLSEVRALRQDLRLSLNRAQTMQILLARLQMQEGVITRSSDHLNNVRQKLLEARSTQKELALELKRLEDSVEINETGPQQAELQDRIRHVKSTAELAGDTAQQQQQEEIHAEQQLRDEQDKLNAIENQLDELVRTATNSGVSKGNHP